jgi:hypothetical protein
VVPEVEETGYVGKNVKTLLPIIMILRFFTRHILSTLGE